MTPKVSVIIPVYNAEKYIRKCVESLFRQTLQEIEYIFVDDCTPDDSIKILNEVLEEFPERKKMVKIIRMSQNSKQAAARNEGICHVTGEYTIHCDPDDWVDEDYYYGLYATAKSEDLDIVIGRYIFDYDDVNISTENKIERIIIPSSQKARDYLFEKRPMNESLWNHLIRTDLIKSNQLEFFPGIDYSEDFCFVVRTYVLADKIGKSEKGFYHYYQGNCESICKRELNPKILHQAVEGLTLLDTFIRFHSIDPFEIPRIRKRKSNAKDKFLIIKDYQCWKQTFPEVADWNFANPNISPVYRYLYKFASDYCTWPLRVYIAISDRLKGRTYSVL